MDKLTILKGKNQVSKDAALLEARDNGEVDIVTDRDTYFLIREHTANTYVGSTYCSHLFGNTLLTFLMSTNLNGLVFVENKLLSRQPSILGSYRVFYLSPHSRRRGGGGGPTGTYNFGFRGGVHLYSTFWEPS